jgi:hypothetical protein
MAGNNSRKSVEPSQFKHVPRRSMAGAQFSAPPSAHGAVQKSFLFFCLAKNAFH